MGVRQDIPPPVAKVGGRMGVKGGRKGGKVCEGEQIPPDGTHHKLEVIVIFPGVPPTL